MAFPICWTIYKIDAAQRNVSPCSVDIVGTTMPEYPALYYEFNPDDSLSPVEIAFRMRLNATPLSNNDPNILDQFVWGVEIYDGSGPGPGVDPQYTVRVEASGVNDRLQILDSTGTIIYNEAVVLGPNGNVQVVRADSCFPCDGPSGTADYFLDFKVPLSEFQGGLDFFTGSEHVFCYYTSTNDQNINKDYVCGDAITPEVPKIMVYKNVIPSPVTACETEKFTVEIIVKNLTNVALQNLTVTDMINEEFIITTTPSPGTFIPPNTLTYTIDNLPANETNTFTFTVSGYFLEAGEFPFDSVIVTNSVSESYVGPIITVLPFTFDDKVSVSGKIKDCETGELLDNVSLTVYDSNCQVVLTQEFNGSYTLELEQGSYTVEFTREGYQRKFIAVILESTEPIKFNICLRKKSICQITPPPGLEHIELSGNIIKEKFDMDILFSQQACLPIGAKIECLNDVIDTFTTTIICTSKLYLNLVIEKNIIFKRSGGAKDFDYFTYPVKLCLPVRNYSDNTELISYYKVSDVDYCQIGSSIINFAHIKYIGHLIEKKDVCITAKSGDC